jgi:hypothetical protein
LFSGDTKPSTSKSSEKRRADTKNEESDEEDKENQNNQKTKKVKWNKQFDVEKILARKIYF